jgi:uncharacterized protein YybS (DUF2232 family)
MHTKQRRTGRQIPEWIVLSVTFSLSVILGTPVAARLRISYPEANKVLLAALGIGFGFFLLVLIVSVWVLFFGLLQKLLDKRHQR